MMKTYYGQNPLTGAACAYTFDVELGGSTSAQALRLVRMAEAYASGDDVLNGQPMYFGMLPPYVVAEVEHPITGERVPVLRYEAKFRLMYNANWVQRHYGDAPKATGAEIARHAMEDVLASGIAVEGSTSFLSDDLSDAISNMRSLQTEASRGAINGEKRVTVTVNAGEIVSALLQGAAIEPVFSVYTEGRLYADRLTFAEAMPMVTALVDGIILGLPKTDPKRAAAMPFSLASYEDALKARGIWIKAVERTSAIAKMEWELQDAEDRVHQKGCWVATTKVWLALWVPNVGSAVLTKMPYGGWDVDVRDANAKPQSGVSSGIVDSEAEAKAAAVAKLQEMAVQGLLSCAAME